MRRLLLLILPALGFASSAVPEAEITCDFRSEWRGKETRYYAPKANVCLEAPTEGIRYDRQIERDIFNLVNAARLEAGLSELSLRSELRAPARLHSFDMAQENFVEHEGPDGRDVADRIGALDRTLIYSEARENLAFIGGDIDFSDAARMLHTLLMESDGHRGNILAPDITHFAVGVSRTEDSVWVTEVFVRQEGALSAALPVHAGRGDAVSVGAELNDWTVQGAKLKDSDGEYHELDAAGLRGEFGLEIVGSRMLDERRQQIIRLPGPSITLGD